MKKLYEKALRKAYKRLAKGQEIHAIEFWIRDEKMAEFKITTSEGEKFFVIV